MSLVFETFKHLQSSNFYLPKYYHHITRPRQRQNKLISRQMVPMEHPPPLSFVLPNQADIPCLALDLLDGNFEDLQDLLLHASNLTSHLKHDTSHLNDRLLHLRMDLTKHAVSWISTSLSAKVSLDDLRLNLQSLLTLRKLLHRTNPRVYLVMINMNFV